MIILTKFGIILLINNMLRTIKMKDYHCLSEYNNLHLPGQLQQLLVLYQNEEAQFIRMCILSKIKQNIISHAYQQLHQKSTQGRWSQQSHQYLQQKRDQLHRFQLDDKNPNTIFSALFLRFLKRGYRNRSIPKSELKLFYHVMSLAIKYFYNEDHFKFLFNEITDLIQNHKERIQTALDFFVQVIATIEYNYQQSIQYESSKQQRINHCRFQRHFTTNHLNSMLMIANFFMEKAILRDNEAVEDGLIYENFKMKASQEHIHSILELLHRVLCFDFIGEKYSEYQDNFEFTSIIIPTKNTKYSNLSQFEKWLKNSDWIRIYQYIYHNSQMVQIRLLIIELLGDMARIHMKYFKNKNCYRVHIENIIFALADVMDQAELIQSKDNLIKIAIAVGRNLLKLTSSAIIPIFFDINTNIFTGLLQNIKAFVVDQIIIEDIFNANVIYYFFKFIHNLHIRCMFEKNSASFELVEKVTREICRNYENYFRLLLKKLFRSNYYQKDCCMQLRQDFTNLRQSFENYNIEQLMIYLYPFQFMKPRYTSPNSVQQLFILTCAKFNRAIYIISTFTNNVRERQFGLQMIEKSIIQIIQWFAFTAYSKDNKDREHQDKTNSRFSSKFQDNFELNMEPISEEYGQQIENESQYCQMLRVICFIMVECLNRVPIKIYKELNTNNQIFKLTNLIMVLCFQSDLQQSENQSRLNCTVLKIIQQKMLVCLQILEKLFLKQWQYRIFMLNKQQNVKLYTYQFNSSQIVEVEFIQVPDLQDQQTLLETIRKIRHPHRQYQIAQYLKKIECTLAYNIATQQKRQIANIISIHSIEDCMYGLELISTNATLVTLLQLSQPTIVSFFELIIMFVRQYRLQQFNKIHVANYLRTLSCMANVYLPQIQQQAVNKMFLFLKDVIPYIKQLQHSPTNNIDQVIEIIHRIDDQFIKNKKQLEFVYLYEDIKQILERYLETDKKDQEHSKIHQSSQKIPAVLVQNVQSNVVSKGYQQKPQLSLQQQTRQIGLSNPQQIYNGYHRQMTMSILDKYTEQAKQQESMVIQSTYECKEINDQLQPIQKMNEPMVIQQQPQSITNSHTIQQRLIYGQSEHNIQVGQKLILAQSIGVLNKEYNEISNETKNIQQTCEKMIKQDYNGGCDETKLNLSDVDLQNSQNLNVNQ